tara:strand:+ start:1979 stop:2881 length:903 start_codon:yes stop_codon:yes gene_type:complete
MSALEKVKELRDVTGAGMQDCKNALKENNNNIEKSIEYLRKKGVLKAAKKSSRDAAEGLIILGEDKNTINLTEINSETDFVAKNEEFINFCKKISETSVKVDNFDDLNNIKIDDVAIKDLLINLVSKIGENIKLRRFKKILKENSKSSFYVHNKVNNNMGKIISVLKYNSNSDESEQFASNICMHIAAMSPMALNEDNLDNDFINQEKKIIEEQIDKNGKKPEILEKIVKGKLNKVISENTLLNQKWVIDQELTVSQAIENFNKKYSDNFTILDFFKFKVGEGIEIKKIDFSEEVKSLTK